MRHLVSNARADPPARLSVLLEQLERPLLWVERQLSRALPEAYNPLAQLGALANTSLFVAVLSGVLVLFFYSSSVGSAWTSVHELDLDPYGSGLIRSVHRYSSDLALLLAVLHGGRLFLARRFSGPRSFAWITGLCALFMLWLVGWLGYWLVWDETAEAVARTTAKLLDPVPIFAEPLSRAFLVDGKVNSLLFFVIFFVHMLIPLVAGICLWLHVTRLARARFLPDLRLAAAVLGVLVLCSVLFPARAAGPAKLLVEAPPQSVDGWFLLPLYLNRHFGSLSLWGLLALSALLLLSIPWLLTRARAKAAQVHGAACNGCERCYEDCPYDAIQMVPRTDGLRFATVAQVDPDRCVGCGICAGSCDPGGIALPQLPTLAARKQVDQFSAAPDKPFVLFACANSAAAKLAVDANGRADRIQGFSVVAAPCAGWVQPRLIERALKQGARGVLIVGCGPIEPTYREGGRWMRHRLLGTRAPSLRLERIESTRVRYVELDRGDEAGLLGEVERFRRAVDPGEQRKSLLRRGIVVGALMVTSTALLVGPSRLPFGGAKPDSGLLVSFRLPGQLAEGCRPATEADNANLPAHMRRPQICERRRAPVRLRVMVDGEVALERAFEPGGLRRDGTSLAIEHVPLSAGAHTVKVELSDSINPNEWTYASEQQVAVGEGTSWAVLFERGEGFSWHRPG